MKLLMLAFIAFGLALSTPAIARDYDPILTSSPPTSFGEQWSIGVSVTQEEIGTSVEIGRVASDSAGGGGILGALIIAGRDNKGEILRSNAQQRAEGAVRPLREALRDYDIQADAMEATATAFKTPNVQAINNAGEFFAASSGKQVGGVFYSFSLSPDFTQIRVTADIDLALDDAKKPVISQRVTSIVLLKKRSYEPSINVARWSDNDGALAKAALMANFDRLSTMIPALLQISGPDFAERTDRKKPKIFAAGFYGPELFRDDLGATVWTDEAAIAVQSK